MRRIARSFLKAPGTLRRNVRGDVTFGHLFGHVCCGICDKRLSFSLSPLGVYCALLRSERDDRQPGKGALANFRHSNNEQWSYSSCLAYSRCCKSFSEIVSTSFQFVPRGVSLLHLYRPSALHTYSWKLSLAVYSRPLVYNNLLFQWFTWL